MGKVIELDVIEKENRTELSFSTINEVQKRGVEIEDAGNCLRLSGNVWQAVKFKYSVTSDTIMEFEYKSEVEPELSLIVFDTNKTWPDSSPYMQLCGSMKFKDSFGGVIPRYDGSGEWKKYTVEIGKFLSGSFNKLIFSVDDDRSDVQGNSFYRNISFYEKAEHEIVSKPQDTFTDSEDISVEVIDDEPEEPKYNPFNNPNLRVVEPQMAKFTTASGMLGKVYSDSEINVLDLKVSGMTAGLSVSYRTLLSMLSLETVSADHAYDVKWNFKADASKFSYLSPGESLRLVYSIKNSNYSEKLAVNEVFINVVGTDTEPVVLNKLLHAGMESHLQIKDLWVTKPETNEELSLTMNGPLQEEFIFQLDTQLGTFTFNPDQFKYLQEDELLEFHISRGINGVKEQEEILSVMVIGHCGFMPSLVIVDCEAQRKAFMKFYEYSVIQTSGRAMREALTVPEKHEDSMVFALGHCHLNFETKLCSQGYKKDYGIAPEIYTEKTRVDFGDSVSESAI